MLLLERGWEPTDDAVGASRGEGKKVEGRSLTEVIPDVGELGF